MFDGYSFKIAQTTIAGTRTPNLQAQRTATINSKQLTDHVLSSIIRGRDVCRLLLLAGVALKDDEMITEFLARCSSSPTGVELLVNKGVRRLCATDTRYIGPARALVDDALWKQVVSMRSNYDTSELEALLRLNFEHLPVGNAYSEFLVKLIKGSTSESRAYTGTLLRALRARAASHVWLLDQATFQLVRKILGHNIALRAAPRPTIVDASHLDLSITSKNHSEPQLSALKVEDSRRKQGKIEYQVRWKGFHSDGDMTWEPATALAGCSALISDFDNKKEKR